MLGDAVSRGFGATWPHEIFHRRHAGPEIDFRSSDDIEKRYNFFNFRYELFRTKPELSFPSRQNQSAIFDSFLEYMASSAQSDRHLLDVKYSSWHHLNWYWTRPLQRPFLLQHVMKRRLPIVHLKRDNLFALYCSHRLAEETNLWRTTGKGIEQSRQPLTIDVAHCRQRLEESRATTQLFDEWLGNYPRYEMKYEELLAGDKFSETVVQAFTQIYGSPPPAALATVYVKVTPPLREIVVNRDEVLAELRGTDFMEMAEKALS